jgi:beta-ureidopropionase / N-carbamoyl-L-amino-acid hydrolase
MIEIDGERLLKDLRALAEFGKAGTGVDRLALSAPDLAARRWLTARFAEVGLAAGMDRVGNVFGRDVDASRTVLIGSHTDSVPMGGWLDGALGVIYGLEIARTARARGYAGASGIDLISFQDEEGTYLPCLGSRSFCGDVADSEIAAARAKNGDALSEALAAVALELPPFRLDPARHRVYVEAHIEQGPRLESSAIRIGVVTGLVGIRRYRISFRGQADHAGTTPMATRKDAGATLISLAHRINTNMAALGSADTVWNIGQIVLRPGTPNVVPSEGEILLEIRDPQTEVLERIESEVLRWVTDIANSGPVAVAVQPTTRIPPTLMTPELGDAITAAARNQGEKVLAMPSGAGHDAMVLGRFIPSAMMFIPSIGGRSHDVTENTSDDDIVAGCRVLAAAIAQMLETLPQ